MLSEILKIQLSLSIIILTTCGIIAISNAAAQNGAIASTSEKRVMTLDFETGQSLTTKLSVNKSARLTADDAQAGKQSLEVKGMTPGQTFHTAAILDNLPVQPGRFYRLGVWIHSSPTVLPTMISVQVHDKLKKGVAMIAISQAPLEWRHFTGEIFIPLDWSHPFLRLGSYLTKDEWVRFDDVTLDLLPPRLEGSYTCFSDRQIIEVKVNAASYLSALGKDAVMGKITWRNSAGKTVLERAIDTFPDSEATFDFDIHSLPQDHYSISIQLFDRKNKKLDEKQLDFEVFREPVWAGNKIGILDAADPPPAPWTPLIYSHTKTLATAFGGPAPDEIEQGAADTINCWGRSQQFIGGVFPSQIDVLHQPILAAPIRLEIQTPEGTFAPSHWTWTQDAGGPQHGQFHFEGQDRGLRVSGKMEIEFDGMMKYSVSLAPSGDNPVTIKSMSLQLPLQAAQSNLFYCPTMQSWENRNDTAATDSDWKIDQWQPLIWVGSEKRGLSWFAESQQNWQFGGAPFAEAHTEGTRRLVRINMVNEPLEITKPVEYVFGLQATPTRPRIADWPQMHFRTPVHSNLDVLWANPHYTKYFGFPAVPADDGKVLKETIAKERQDGSRWLLIYQMLNFAPDPLPEWKYYWREWTKHPRVRDASLYTPVTAVDVRRKDWRDLQAYYLQDYLKRFDLDGIYVDGGGGPQQNADGWSIFAARDLLKRAYILTHQLKPNGLVWIHGGTFPPVSSFSDIVLIGEQFRQQLYRNPYYLSFMTLKQFRQELVPDMGQPRMLLSQLRGPAQLEKKPTVHLMGMALLHNLDVYPHALNEEVFADMVKYRMEFKDAAFTGYWQADNHIQASADTIAISYYRKSGKMLAVLLNASPQPVKAEVTLHLNDLGLPAAARATLYDPLTGHQDAIPHSEHFTVLIEGYAAMLVEIE